MTSGVVKQSHHAVFDEASYLQPLHPPATQLLYNLGLKDNAPVCDARGDTEIALYPPTSCLKSKGPNKLPIVARHLHLPLQESVTLSTYGTRADTVMVDDPFSGTVLQCNHDVMIVTKFGITLQNMEQVFFSWTAYNDAFEEYLDMKHFYPTSHPASGMHFFTEGDCLILQHMAKGLLCTKIRNWRSRLKGAWLISLNDRPVLSVKDINEIFEECLTSGSPQCTLLFSHPDVRHGLTNEGIPQISLDQLNPRMMFHGFTPPTPTLCNCNRI